MEGTGAKRAWGLAVDSCLRRQGQVAGETCTGLKGPFP